MKHVSRFGYHIFYKFLSVTYQDSNLCSICFSGNQQIRTWFYLRNVCGIDVSTFFQHCTSNTAVQFCCHNSYTKVAQSNSTFTDCQNSVSCVGHTIFFFILVNFFWGGFVWKQDSFCSVSNRNSKSSWPDDPRASFNNFFLFGTLDETPRLAIIDVSSAL